MYPIERQLEIFELAKVNDVLKLKDLTDKFNISIETLRRDLSVLEKQGKIQKIYGGIKLAETYSGEPLMQNRMENKLEIKEIIGKKCSEFVIEGDCIFLDSGSTTYHIAKNIKNIKNLKKSVSFSFWDKIIVQFYALFHMFRKFEVDLKTLIFKW